MLQRLKPERQGASHEQWQAELPAGALGAKELGHTQAGEATKDTDR
jgi:hypothetical protein